MEYFGAGITTNHLPILCAYFAFIIALGLLALFLPEILLLFCLNFVLLLLWLNVRILKDKKITTIWNFFFFLYRKLGLFEGTIS